MARLKYLPLPLDIDSVLDKLSAEDGISVIKALLNYAKGERLPCLSDMAEVAFLLTKGQVGQHIENYEARCKTNQNNVNKRWARRDSNEDSDTNLYDGIQSNTKNTNDTNVYETYHIKESKIKENKKNKENIPPIVPHGGTEPEEFLEFWSRYPKKQGKKGALKAWRKLSPSPELVNEIMSGLEWRLSCEEWTKDGGKYIPLPASWLNGERWKDERSIEKRQRVELLAKPYEGNIFLQMLQEREGAHDR